MEPNDELKSLWSSNANASNKNEMLSSENLDMIVKSRLKREKKKIAEYFWLSLGYQILVYAFACYLILRYRDDTNLVTYSLTGILLYVPLTTILLSRFKAMFRNNESAGGNIQQAVETQFFQLRKFFLFKKRFDFIAIPLTCALLLIIIFRLYVGKDLNDLIPGGIIMYAIAVAIFAIAAWLENKKHFIRPLRRLEVILRDLHSAEVV